MASRTAPPAIFDGVHARDKVEILADAQVLIEAEPLRHVADLPLDGSRLRNHIVAEACSATIVRPKKAAQHADEGGLAAAVGAEKSIDLAATNLKIDMVDNRAAAEPLGHSAHVDGQVFGHVKIRIQRPPVGLDAVGRQLRDRSAFRS